MDIASDLGYQFLDGRDIFVEIAKPRVGVKCNLPRKAQERASFWCLTFVQKGASA
ncbi:hypothetical protein ACS0TY_019343 [Phlomoides rotata]